MLYILGTIVYIGLVLYALYHLILTGERPVKTLAWLIAILTIPFVGLFMYYLIGINRRRLKFNKKSARKHVKSYHKKIAALQKSRFAVDKSNWSVGEAQLERLIRVNSSFVATQGNLIRPLYNGSLTFEAIFEAMEEAKHFIHVQYYIFEEGDLTNRFLEIFRRKADQGVKVRLIYDGLGSFGLSRSYRQRLDDAGVEHACYLPIVSKRIDSTLNFRNHRKIVIVDGEIGFTGGINVTDKYIKGDPELGDWYDIHLQLEGPAVASLNAVFLMDWYYGNDNGELLDDDFFPIPKRAGNMVAQIVHSGPDNSFSSVQQQYFQLINRANKYVYIANSYVIPGEAILLALKTAAISGKEVRLLLPKHSDSKLVEWTIRSYLPELIKANIKVYLFDKGFLHCKMVLVDDEVASIGTANLDIRSFEQNFEVNVLMYDEDITRELKNHFLSYCSMSELYTEEDVKNRSHRTKILEGMARVFSPIL